MKETPDRKLIENLIEEKLMKEGRLMQQYIRYTSAKNMTDFIVAIAITYNKLSKGNGKD